MIKYLQNILFSTNVKTKQQLERGWDDEWARAQSSPAGWNAMKKNINVLCIISDFNYRYTFHQICLFVFFFCVSCIFILLIDSNAANCESVLKLKINTPSQTYLHIHGFVYHWLCPNTRPFSTFVEKSIHTHTQIMIETESFVWNTDLNGKFRMHTRCESLETCAIVVCIIGGGKKTRT